MTSFRCNNLISLFFASAIVGGANPGTANAQSTVLFYEDFLDGALAPNAEINFPGEGDSVTLANGIASFVDASTTSRPRFTAVQSFNAPLMTFQFDYVAPIVPTTPTRMEVLFRAGVGTAQNTPASADQVVEVITFRGTDDTGSRIGTSIETKSVFLAYNNKETSEIFISPVDGVSEVTLQPFQYVPYVLDRSSNTFAVMPSKGVSNANPATGRAITRIGIGSGTNTDQGTFAIDNVLIRTGIVFDRTFPAPVLEADYNANKAVDAPDLALWRARFGGVAPFADADKDGDTDGYDFIQWQRSLGSTIPAVPAMAAVPEPTSLLPLVIGLLATLGSRRRSKRRPA